MYRPSTRQVANVAVALTAAGTAVPFAMELFIPSAAAMAVLAIAAVVLALLWAADRAAA